MSLARLRRLFVYAPPDPVAYWRGRARDPGCCSVMWTNPNYNERAHRDQWAAILRSLPERRDAVLDLGCGTGRLSEELQALFASYTGVDLDTMVAEAERRHPALASRYVVSSVQDYAFPAASFDLVLSIACLATACRADELPAAAARIAKATRPGGRVLLIEPFHTLAPLVRTCRLRAAEVVALFESLGLALVEWKGLHFIPTRLLVARRALAKAPRLSAAGYAAGERMLRLAPRRLADYHVIALRKP
jgi:SAM-dependent methyltransferase